MAQYFLAAINGRPTHSSAKSIAWELAKIEYQCKIIDRLIPLGGMNYSSQITDGNNSDMVAIARLCIQLSEYGKLNKIKRLLYSMKAEIVAQNPEFEEDFSASEKVLDDARIETYEASIRLEEIMRER